MSTQSVFVHADATRLDQVISNLLVDALKYTPDGGRVDVEVRPEAGNGVLVIRDSGIGISEQLLPRVFDIFVQGSASLDRAQGGLGIGLALVHRLVELHGGTVRAASAGAARGSTFTVHLPAVNAPAVASLPAAAGSAVAACKCVLIVDDHEDARAMVREIVALAGHRVVEARDGGGALEVAFAELPDVAIIDIGLPGIDGYEVARRLRTDPRTRRMALIALTGYGLQDDRRRALEAGYDVHLAKPVDAGRITAAIISTVPAAAA